MAKEYEADVRGVCQWACDNAGLSFDRLDPKNVTVTLQDGSQFTGDAPPARRDWGGKILTIRIDHPDSEEPIIIDIDTGGARKQ